MKPDDYQLSDYIYENPNEYNNYIVNTYIYVEYVATKPQVFGEIVKVVTCNLGKAGFSDALNGFKIQKKI